MPAVDEYREALLRQLGIWDTLSMLGQMSDTLPDIAATRSAFQALTATLMDKLARQLLSNAVHGLRSKAQVAIDILVRNLFERTADVGFLATDSALRAFMQGEQTPAARTAIETRLRAYVAKYSVYDDVLLLSPRGRVLARLDDSIAADAESADCTDPWFTQALRGGTPYVEHHGLNAALGGRCGLVYAAAVRAERGADVLGVLCLSFRLDDEMRGIHQQLLRDGNAAVIALIDADGAVVSSSDPWQLPVGARLAHLPRGGDARQRLRFAGRDYLAAAARPTGYEGYRGPGWSALALIGSELAFDPDAGSTPAHDDTPAARSALTELANGVDTRGLFPADLRAIPGQARRIQRDLASLLWNGKLRRGADGSAITFAATLLHEVGQTGGRIRDVFEQATGELQRAALAEVFDEARDRARLAVDILCRNLYERANDCRWWALDGALRHCLAQPGDAQAQRQASAVLQHINGLYTVYSLLLLFDGAGRIVAVSNPAQAARCGELLDEPWLRETLALRDGEDHAVSRHQPSALYDDRATYIYAAAVRGPDGRVNGGVAIVFDGAPQFSAMLASALPPATDVDTNVDEATDKAADMRPSALFVSRGGEVLSSTDARWPIGSPAPLPPGWASLARGESGHTVLDLDGVAHAAGFGIAGGYREYPRTTAAAADEVGALVLMPLGERLPAVAPAVAPFEARTESATNAAGKDRVTGIAGFLVDGQWLGLPTASVIESVVRPRITVVANAGPQLLGMLLHEDAMLPVLDLALLRGGAPNADAQAPVVLARTRAGQRFGLRVAELGPVFEVPERQLQPVAQAAGAGEFVVRGGSQQPMQMLLLIDADAIAVNAGIARATPQLQAA